MQKIKCHWIPWYLQNFNVECEKSAKLRKNKKANFQNWNQIFVANLPNWSKRKCVLNEQIKRFFWKLSKFSKIRISENIFIPNLAFIGFSNLFDFHLFRQLQQICCSKYRHNLTFMKELVTIFKWPLLSISRVAVSKRHATTIGSG